MKHLANLFLVIIASILIGNILLLTLKHFNI
jgi:hypothetical protein